jgi:hypothetical protein
MACSRFIEGLAAFEVIEQTNEREPKFAPAR